MTEKQEETIKRLTNGEKIDFNTLVRTLKKEGIENFVVTKKEYIETVLNMLKEKDKIIDLMTKHIANSAIVDDTVCAIKCDCETDIREDCTYEKMLNCTKQYFKNKVEENKN